MNAPRYRHVPLGGSLSATFTPRADGTTLVMSDEPLRRVSYAEALAQARSIAQAFIDYRLSPEHPVAILSDNDIEHLLIGLGAMLAGVPLAPISPAYSRVAERSAYFGLPEGQRGIFLGGGGSVRVSKLIGGSRVTEMMLTGRVYNAEEAFQVGLTHYTVPEGEGLAKGLALARRIASNAPLSNFAIMQALPLIAEQPLAHGLLTEGLMATVTQSDGEAKARMRAFLEKRAGKVAPSADDAAQVQGGR